MNLRAQVESLHTQLRLQMGLHLPYSMLHRMEPRYCNSDKVADPKHVTEVFILSGHKGLVWGHVNEP